MEPSASSLFPSRHLSLSSLQLTPRVQELSSRLPSAGESQHCVFVQEDDEQQHYDLPVDAKQFDRATAIKPCSMLRPHMRIFYLSWMSAITGFFGWYAIPPLMPAIKTHLGLTDGQVLNSDIASTASTIFSRIASGPLLDRFGPRAVQSSVLWLGAIPIFCAAFVNSATSLLLVRFFIGLVGCVFVSSQYWTTITFARNVVGTANAVTGGLEVAGVGFAFLLLPFVYHVITYSGHVSEDLGWRITIALPGVLMITMGVVIRFAVDNCPTRDFKELMDKKKLQSPAKHPSLMGSFRIVLSDRNVLIMIVQYAACFGTELQLNNMGALYFYTEFDKEGCVDEAFCSLLSKTNAATIASSFGLTNLFARAVGGLMSDAVNRRLGMRGRQYVQCLLLCVLAALVMALSQSHSLGVCIAFYVLVAIVAQASCGSTYGIVPYLNEHHTGTVNGLVGAGGNMGGALFGVIFRITGSYHTGLAYMAIFIFCCALLTPLLRLSYLHHKTMSVGSGAAQSPQLGQHNALLSSSSLVQVAPLPLTADFHAGKVLELGAPPPPSTQEREETYIPVALARAQLSKVVADMHAMKAEQVQKLGEILEHYRGIEKDTRDRHEARVRALKERAESKLKESREQKVELEKAGELREELHTKEKKELLNEQEKQRLQHLEAHETWRREFECALQTHEDQVSREQKAALNEIDRVSRVAAHTGQRSHQLQHELEMCSEDAYSQAMRVDGQLRRARMDMETQHEAFLDREAKLRRNFAANLEVERFLHALIDIVVDRKQQDAEAKRDQSLQTQLRNLEAKAKAAGSREEVLKRRLKAARDRFEFMEAQAVQETVELLVHAVVVTIEREPRKVCAVTSDAPTQTMEVKVESSIVEAEAPPAIPELPLDKTKYESEVEVVRERNIALIRSKAALHEAKEKLEELTKNKKTVKTAVKTWLSTFQVQYGREPTIEDKAQVKDKYLAFKEAEKAFSAQKALVLTLKQQHRELALRIDASSRWSALGSAVVKSPRTERGLENHESIEEVSIQQNFDKKSSRPASGSASRPLPPVETKDGCTDAAEFQAEAVATLEKEIQELRSQLAVVSAQQLEKSREEEFDARETAVRAQPAEIIETANAPPKESEEFDHVKSRPEDKDEVSTAAQFDVVQEKSTTEKEFAEGRRLREEVKAREEELDRQQQQRLLLQEEITTLSQEIEERRAEKARLEAEIEQLRLHLELSEERDRTTFDNSPPSEPKADRDDELEAKGVDEVDSGEDQEENDYEEDEFEVAPAEAKDVDDEPLEQDFDDEKEEPEEDESQQVKEDAARSLHLVQAIVDAVARGKAQFNRGDKAKCYQTYAKCAEKCIVELQALHEKHRRQGAVVLKRVLTESARLPPARGPQTLRKQLDVVRESCEQWLNTREELAVTRLAERNARKEAKAAASVTRKQQLLETKQKKAEQRDDEKKHHKKKSSPPQGNTSAAGNGKALEETKQKLRALEAKSKADRIKFSQLEAALSKAETQLASGGSSNATGGAGSTASDRRVVDMEKKQKKALEDSEKAAKKEISALTQQLQTAQKAFQELQEQAAALQKELGVAGGRAKQLGQLEVEVTQLREQAALVAPLNNELREAKVQFATLETSYREEQTLRKKYYNQIEDMKGKIRVYARCRPMSGSENERGCAPCVKFLDEFSMEVSGGNRAAKTFAYDQAFSPASTQVQVFEDTKNLLQSAVDGYNVCIFAYGQTGSGKTFTMTGVDRDPGLSPRTIHHLFALAEEVKANFTVTFQATMLELYNDTLIDLFHLVDGGGAHDTKLDIKKNDKGMVVVQNATLKKCTSPEQTLRLFDAANKKRQVGATKMNAESSRSHSIFSLLVESYNKTTKATTIGKLSLVDLAGSERAGKTGATADRLKEAQAINKSLSALGDVISALSTNEKFIPYRNNKLTQLMQDSLGGNAKTLMFVNISPADYNQEETVTSLTYASRVKLITNNANKNSESEQVNRLKAIIKQLRAGKADVDLEGVLD